MLNRFLRKRVRPLIAVAALLGACAATAQTKLDISLPWGPNEFHSLNAAAFAARVKEETKGEVVMATHPGGTLGVKANESLRSIGEGVVPMGEFALFQNASRGASLAVETLPFLVDDYEQLRTLHRSFRPLWDGVMARNNVKTLYVVPWPNQFFFLKKPANTLKDLSGVKMRSLDRLTTDWINRLGMVPVQMTNPEILQALGSGMIDGVPTSAGTAVAQKYWDFMKFGYQTNHIWSSNAMVINLDTWKKLTPSQQAAIEKVAREMEPQFWEASRQDHEKKVAELKANGMTVSAAPKAMVDEMKAVTGAQWASYVKPMGDDAAAALADFRKVTKK
ncbi:MAG: c4-dicarboxylate-binding protein [Comamonadaceae bacterium]|nr:MAG: c4-dicarboxylate-binding protein [Comamonadaceae bacterium]